MVTNEIRAISTRLEQSVNPQKKFSFRLVRPKENFAKLQKKRQPPIKEDWRSSKYTHTLATFSRQGCFIITVVSINSTTTITYCSLNSLTSAETVALASP